MRKGQVYAAIATSFTATTEPASNAVPRLGATAILCGFAGMLLGCGEPAVPHTGPLNSLALTTPAGAPIALRPSFSPDIHDYVIPCAAGSNPFLVNLATDPERTLSISLPMPTIVAGQQTASIELAVDQAVVISASAADGSATQYWLRCLPPDFPALTVTAHPGKGTATPGWYLIGSGFPAAGASGYAMVLDGNGTPVWYQRAAGGAFNVELVADNTLAFYSQTPGQYQIRHLDSGKVEQIQTEGSPTDVHELYHLPNGNNLLLSYPPVAGVDLTGLQTFGAASTILDCAIQEIDPSGNLVWQWHASDHVDPVREATYPMSKTTAGQTVIDVFHCNSIEAASNGDLMVSARHMDAVFMISKATGRILWKLGGSAYSKDEAQLITIEGDADVAFFRQHDARFLPDGSISLFDDRTDVSGVARGVEYAIDFGTGSARLIKQYLGPASSRAMGSFRHYADGSRLVGWGNPSAGSLVATEFDADANAVLDFSFQKTDYSYRALKAPLSSLDIKLLRQAVGAP